jgi:hypothetical protein
MLYAVQLVVALINCVIAHWRIVQAVRFAATAAIANRTSRRGWFPPDDTEGASTRPPRQAAATCLRLR